MKQTIYTCDWCNHEITGDRVDIKYGKQTFHMCGPCYWDKLAPILAQTEAMRKKDNDARGDHE